MAGKYVTYLLVGVLGILVFGPILLRVVKRSLDLIEPAMWFGLFYFAHFGVRAIYDLLLGSPIIGLSPGSEDLAQLNLALGVSIMGLLAFGFGYLSAPGKLIGNSLPKLPSRWNVANALMVAWLCLLVGWAVRLFLIYRMVGAADIAAWLTKDKYVALAEARGLVYLMNVTILAKVGLFVLFALAKVRRNTTLYFTSMFFLILELLFTSVSGSRAQLVFVLLGLVVISYMTSSRRGYGITMRYFFISIALIMVLIILFPVFSILRAGTVNPQEVFSRSLKFWMRPLELFEVVWSRQHGLDSLVLLLERVPAYEDFNIGDQLTFLAVVWIPRALWPEKPVTSLGKIFYEDFYPPIFHSGTSVAVTLPGQFYWGLGFIGVLIGMLSIGILWQALSTYFVRPKGNMSNILVVSTMFPTFFVAVEQDTIFLFSTHLVQLALVVCIAIAIRGKSMIGKVRGL